MAFYIGTSGWQYSHWRGNFYPADLPYKEWLKFYSKHFNSVEINSTFYRQTRLSTFKKWSTEVPPNFIFSVKGNRFITHIKRLKDCEAALKIFFDSASVLVDSKKNADRKHVVLWQLPPSLKKDRERLKTFLDLLSRTDSAFLFRHTFEFRHASWVDSGVFEILINSKIEANVCFQDWKDWPRIFEDEKVFTKYEKDLNKLPFVYVRFHGKKVLYTSGYSREDLAYWAKSMQEWNNGGKDVYAYFNNDALGYAVENARTLKGFLGLI